MWNRMTPFARFLIVVVLGACVFFGVKTAKDKGLIFQTKTTESVVPSKVDLPNMPESAPPSAAYADKASTATPVVLPTATPVVASADNAARFMVWEWNAQSAIMLSNGGKKTTQGSLQSKHLKGGTLEFIHNDNNGVLQASLINLAQAWHDKKPIPQDAVMFVAVMGDGAAQFIQPIQEQLQKIDPTYTVEVIGSGGRSDGEDKYMDQPAVKKDPQAARGTVIAGVLRDGDWNIALKWAGDNGIKNNPDEGTWDPDAINWVNADNYLKAAEMYNAQKGFAPDDPKCGDRKEKVNGKLTGKVVHKCITGVVTWMPGDINIAHQRGGLVSIVSTHEYRAQMPNTIIGFKQWNEAHAEYVAGMLAGFFEAADQFKVSPEARRKAAEISALVYEDKDAPAEFWEKYFTVQTEKDTQGLTVQLGGSQVFNLADNLNLFGLSQGSDNLFAATYTKFANLVVEQYPDTMKTYPPAAQIVNTRYLKRAAELLAADTKPVVAAQPAEVAKFDANVATVKEKISAKSWHIEFKNGKDEPTPAGYAELEKLKDDLEIANGLAIELHGYTDNRGKPEQNLALSERRAFAVRKYLETASPANFPRSRTHVFAHGQENPVESNTTEEGRAANRRVDVVLGTQN